MDIHPDCTQDNLILVVSRADEKSNDRMYVGANYTRSLKTANAPEKIRAQDYAEYF